MSAMNVVLFDDQQRANLLPLAYTRPVADIRVGIITIREKWEALLGKSTSSSTESYLSAKFPLEVASENLFINGSVFPTANLVQSIQNLEPGKALVHGDVLVACGLRFARVALLKNVARSSQALRCLAGTNLRHFFVESLFGDHSLGEQCVSKRLRPSLVVA